MKVTKRQLVKLIKEAMRDSISFYKDLPKDHVPEDMIDAPDDYASFKNKISMKSRGKGGINQADSFVDGLSIYGVKYHPLIDQAGGYAASLKAADEFLLRARDFGLTYVGHDIVLDKKIGRRSVVFKGKFHFKGTVQLYSIDDQIADEVEINVYLYPDKLTVGRSYGSSSSTESVDWWRLSMIGMATEEITEEQWKQGNSNPYVRSMMSKNFVGHFEERNIYTIDDNNAGSNHSNDNAYYISQKASNLLEGLMLEPKGPLADRYVEALKMLTIPFINDRNIKTLRIEDKLIRLDDKGRDVQNYYRDNEGNPIRE